MVENSFDNVWQYPKIVQSGRDGSSAIMQSPSFHWFGLGIDRPALCKDRCVEAGLVFAPSSEAIRPAAEDYVSIIATTLTLQNRFCLARQREVMLKLVLSASRGEADHISPHFTPPQPSDLSDRRFKCIGSQLRSFVIR
jgi:hypothetical protein